MQALRTRARLEGTPLIEEDQVTFLWLGEHPPSIIGDFVNWGVNMPPLTMQQVEPGLWSRTISLPQDAYMEYAFVLDGQRFPDPLNSNVIDDGLGHTINYFRMPHAIDTPLIQAPHEHAHGQLTEHVLPTYGLLSGEMRQVFLYQPVVEQACPLIVVLDGQDYIHKAYLPAIVDNLIAEQRIQPVALALVTNGGTARGIEYACSETTLAFLLHAVLPLAQKHLHLIDVKASPGAYGILGASMGGLMGLYTAVRAPEVFGKVLCESGAFHYNYFDFNFTFRSLLGDLLELSPPLPLRIWMDCSQHEWFLTPNRQMYARLQKKGYDVTYLEHTSGHNYPSWRNVVWKGLEHLFGN